jgi:D-alanine-D-alanine ligase
MDKPRTKMVYSHLGLTTPEFLFHHRADGAGEKRALVDRARDVVGYPCVVKPARLGSSVGISFPNDRDELERAIDALLEDTEDVIVERFVKGREVTCGVLAIDRQERVLALPPTEIIPGAKSAFFDYIAKYTPGASEEITPARIPPASTQEIQRLALRAHRGLGCRDFSRSDFILTDDGRAFMLETNTIPGLTETSLLPQGAQAMGIAYAELIGILVDNAVLRS